MMEYLEATYPDPALLPSDPVACAEVRAAVQLVACDIHPLNNRRILQHMRNDLSLSDEAVQVWEHKWVAAGYRGLEGQVARHAGKYLFGDNVTMADLCLVPQVENGNRAGVNLADFPALYRAYNTACELPAFEAAHPSNQPDLRG
jgi:maleylacetoacetate isomerase